MDVAPGDLAEGIGRDEMIARLRKVRENRKAPPLVYFVTSPQFNCDDPVSREQQDSMCEDVFSILK
jgi:hypothetical protein